MAKDLALVPGDTVFVGNLDSDISMEATVQGIVEQAPDGYGGRIYYNLDTAQARRHRTTRFVSKPTRTFDTSIF